ncbi:MAG: hypothetical protein ACAH80_18545 [Alphaproteobacteria bacterium]
MKGILKWLGAKWMGWRVYVFAGLAIAAAAGVVFAKGYTMGAASVRGKQAEVTIHDVKTANEARDRLRSDPAYARRVRLRFTRDEGLLPELPAGLHEPARH